MWFLLLFCMFTMIFLHILCKMGVFLLIFYSKMQNSCYFMVFWLFLYSIFNISFVFYHLLESSNNNSENEYKRSEFYDEKFTIFKKIIIKIKKETHLFYIIILTKNNLLLTWHWYLPYWIKPTLSKFILFIIIIYWPFYFYFRFYSNI